MFTHENLEDGEDRKQGENRPPFHSPPDTTNVIFVSRLFSCSVQIFFLTGWQSFGVESPVSSLVDSCPSTRSSSESLNDCSKGCSLNEKLLNFKFIEMIFSIIVMRPAVEERVS